MIIVSLYLVLKWLAILIIILGALFLLARNQAGKDTFTALDDMRQARRELETIRQKVEK